MAKTFEKSFEMEYLCEPLEAEMPKTYNSIFKEIAPERIMKRYDEAIRSFPLSDPRVQAELRAENNLRPVSQPTFVEGPSFVYAPYIPLRISSTVPGAIAQPIPRGCRTPNCPICRMEGRLKDKIETSESLEEEFFKRNEPPK